MHFNSIMNGAPPTPEKNLPNNPGQNVDASGRHFRQSESSRKFKLLLWLSFLVAFLAIGFKIIGDTEFDRLKLRVVVLTTKAKLTNWGFNGFSYGFFDLLRKNREKGSGNVGEGFPYKVLWMAPFLSSGGYSSEAWSYVMALDASKLVPNLSILQHGDLESIDFWNGLPQSMKKFAMKNYAGHIQDLTQTVVICHSEPGAWYPPLFETMPCPPFGYDEPFYVIGRTMFETDRVTAEHVRRCNAMDSVWVPTEFHVKSFTESGVIPSKVVKVVQSVDVEYFDPSKWVPLSLPAIGRLFGPEMPENVMFLPSDSFVFLSIFKWEWRKGWDVLLKAFLQEFSADDNVVLYILTNAFHNDNNYVDVVRNFVKESGLKEPPQGWPAVYLCDEHVPQNDLPRLYKAASLFVLPSRGEGWGRPNVEAMAMALPVITTNWSGPTEYLTDDNSYPLPISGMNEVKEGPFLGHFWAEPSVHHLQKLMRHAFSNPTHAKHKGIKARLDMVRNYSPTAVAKQVIRQLSQIKIQKQ